MEMTAAMAVEWALVTHPAVAEAVALPPPEGAAPDAPLRVYVVVQPGQPADEALRAALVAHAQQAAPPGAPLPLEITFVESLPKTRTGKVARWMLGQDGA